MASDYVRIVCENGHHIAVLDPQTRLDPQGRAVSVRHCERCGAPAIAKCLNCDAPIPGGKARRWGVEIPPPPRYCNNCGSPYPWAAQLTPDIPQTAENRLNRLETILTRFAAVVWLLRERRGDRPPLEMEDEYDVQYLLHALLTIEFNDIRAEEWTPSYLGSASRMDFLLKPHRIVVEVKRTSSKLGPKELGEQLAIDISRYRAHPDCKTLVCFIYDPDLRIPNPQGLKRDLEQLGSNGIEVVACISPVFLPAPSSAG